MEEQEDEIKQLNEMILAAKCHAIREAQIAEKQVILHEIKQEELRLDEVCLRFASLSECPGNGDRACQGTQGSRRARE